jgi:hypothetical protein
MDEREYKRRLRRARIYKIGYLIGKGIGWVILGLAVLGLMELIDSISK